MEERAGQPRTIELNDGTCMPLLGLGTWKPEVAFHFYNSLILTSYTYIYRINSDQSGNFFKLSDLPE